MRFGKAFDAIIAHDMRAHITPFLLGEPGIGKSAAVASIAKSMDGRMFTVACNHLAEKADLTGVRTVPVEDDSGHVVAYKQVFFPMEDVTDCVMYAEAHPRETVVLFLDELNRTSGDVTSALLSLQTARRIGTLSIPDNVFIVCAGNDKGNVTSLDDASVSRFQLLRMEPDAQTWLAVNPGANECVSKVLKDHPELVFCREQPKGDDDNDESSDLDDILLDGSEMRQFTTPRTITYLSDWLNGFDDIHDLEVLDSEVTDPKGRLTALDEAVFAIVGRTAFADCVLAEVRSAIAGGVKTNEAAFRVPRPPCVDELLKKGKRSEMMSYVSQLTPENRSSAIVALVCDKTDRTQAIRCLAEGLPTLQGDALFNLMQATHAGLADRDNLEFFKSETEAGEAVSKYV